MAAVSIQESISGETTEPESFGLMLRRARETRGLSVNEVSAATKIPRSTVDVLESGNLDRLPAEVFVRGFIKSYARAVRIEDGRPLHSWRVLLLPFIEQDELFKQFRLDEPWDSAHNLALLPRMPKTYAPPGRKASKVPPHHTALHVFVGPGTPFEERRDATPLAAFAPFRVGPGWTLHGDFPDGENF